MTTATQPSQPESNGYQVIPTKPVEPAWSYAPPPVVTGPEPRSRGEKLLILAIVLVVLGGAGYWFLQGQIAGIMAEVQSTLPSGFRVSTPAPTRTPVAGVGVMVFGSDFDPSTLRIIGQASSFPATTAEIAWSAELREAADATSLTFILASVTPTGSETVVVSTTTQISNPASDTLASKADLATFVGAKAGTYVVRYVRGSKVLAEGKFTLTP